ncbi:MAG: hypothetical protein RIC87_12555 [Kiloniellales bacterium]
MLSEKEIWQSASVMVKRYGSEAVAEAAKRVVELESQGDEAGAAAWRRIEVAIEQLQAKEPDGPVH